MGRGRGLTQVEIVVIRIETEKEPGASEIDREKVAMPKRWDDVQA